MIAKVSTFVVIFLLGIVGADFGFAASLTESCADYLVATNKEQVLGRELAVTQFSRKPEAKGDSGVPIREVFGADPQIIIGIDTSNSNQPYIVAGDGLFLSTRSTTRQQVVFMYNAATKTSVPHIMNITTYHLGELQAERLPRGYFVRISGLSKAQVERLRSGISAQVRAGSSNDSWSNMIINLTDQLSRHSDLKLACQNPTCNFRYDLFERAINDGFSIPGGDQIIKTDFYTIDHGSLEKLMASAKRSKYVGVTAYVTYVGLLGLTTGGLLYLGYQLLALSTGLPLLPTPL